MSDPRLPPLPENISFGSELIKARSQLGLTQAQLAEKSNVSLSAIKGYETGRTMPGARELRELCQALQITPNVLLWGTETPFAPNNEQLFAGLEHEDKRVDRFRLATLVALLTFEERQSIQTLVQGLVIARHGEKRVRELLVENEDFLAKMTNELVKTLAVVQAEIEELSESAPSADKKLRKK
ncbi:helix-turn-helix domain-containing protein [Variovorax sp. HJSM1_2]|uniref:helix-turn-helix domain-containing protein n=1 Tax=Variovorax sp. HJSM1_2 TaxID=3366263 RepID=UPI003BD767F2